MQEYENSSNEGSESVEFIKELNDTATTAQFHDTSLIFW